MTRKAFFCYEKNFASRWCPVIFYDEPPSKSVANGKESAPERSVVNSLPDEYIGEDGEVSISFSRLQDLYPPPLMPVNNEPKLKIEYNQVTETVIERGENATWSDLSKVT